LHAEQDFTAQDVLVFGPETRGLPQEVLAEFAPTQCLRLPMRADNRSINLSNAVAVAVYEAWRQLDYIGGS
jgi:tRNA(Leu) C34 or U34 (ribose-2'-O)-methylase TrmL